MISIVARLTVSSFPFPVPRSWFPVLDAKEPGTRTGNAERGTRNDALRFPVPDAMWRRTPRARRGPSASRGASRSRIAAPWFDLSARAKAVSAAAGTRRTASSGDERMRLMSSKPSISGIPRSRSTTSGRNSLMRSRAPCGEPTAVTSAPAVSSTVVSIASESCSSSTASTRTSCRSPSRRERLQALGGRVLRRPFSASACTIMVGRRTRKVESLTFVRR